MEYMECDETTRSAILDQFKRRELFVPNMQNLSVEELHQIYNGFIAPQPRRERRERQRQLNEFPPNRMDCSVEMPTEMEQIVQRIKVVHVAGEKRSACSLNEHVVHSKRSKIDQSSAKFSIDALSHNPMVL